MWLISTIIIKLKLVEEVLIPKKVQFWFYLRTKSISRIALSWTHRFGSDLCVKNSKINNSQLYGLQYFIFLMSIFKQLSSEISHVYFKSRKVNFKVSMAKWVGISIYALKLYIVICTYFLKIACCLLHIESHWFGNKNFLKNILFWILHFAKKTKKWTQ